MCVKRLKEFLPIDIIKYNVYLKDFSTFGIGGKVSCLLQPKNVKELYMSIKACKSLGLKYQVIGNGSNILFKSTYTKMVIVTTKFLERNYKLSKDEICVSAGAFISEVVLWCIERGLSGLENLYGIPATIGGMVMMNAGAFGSETFDNLIEIEVIENGRYKTIKKENIEYGHHYTSLLKTNLVIVSAKFKLKRLAPSVIKSRCKEIVLLRREKQPNEKSLGSVFRPTKDNVPAGLLIDKLGFKGYKVGGAKVSEKHANFIVNDGDATDVDVKSLINEIKYSVKREYNVNLKREIEYIGDRNGYYR